MGINVLSCGVRSTIHGDQRVELWVRSTIHGDQRVELWG